MFYFHSGCVFEKAGEGKKPLIEAALEILNGIKAAETYISVSECTNRLGRLRFCVLRKLPAVETKTVVKITRLEKSL